jgi:hypothetical protein
VRRTALESENLLATYQIYFPAAFNEQVRNYLANVEQALVAFESQDITNQDYQGLQDNYLNVLEAARGALGVSHLDIGTPSAGVVVAQAPNSSTARAIPDNPR